MELPRAAAAMTGPRRFTVASQRVDAGQVAFDRDETRHMAHVLRLRPGDVVLAGDGQGRDYTVRLDALGETARGTIIGVAASGAESPVAITLVQGVPKGEKMEHVVRAAAELGARRIVPAVVERTVVRLDASRWRDRARRWQRVAREAAKQCGRSFVLEVEVPRPLPDCVDEPADLRLCLWEGDAPPLSEALATAPPAPSSIAVLVGPEGGLAPGEVEQLRQRGWTVVRMGPRILRTETAGPAIIAVLQFHFGDLGGPGAGR
jgi:16S rRNA (uracil1498-N3)-methyltransferase